MIHCVIFLLVRCGPLGGGTDGDIPLAGEVPARGVPAYKGLGFLRFDVLTEDLQSLYKGGCQFL